MFAVCLVMFINFSIVTAKVTSSPPVLIWGVDTPKATSIFRPVTNSQFSKMIKNMQKDNMIVVYLASELAAKDINCDVCFPYLSKIHPMNFYTQVEEPLKAIRRVSRATEEIVYHNPIISDIRKLELEMELPCNKGQIHAFNFNDRNVLAHDAAMAVATYQFSDCPVVHVYTAYTEEDRSYQRRKAYKTRPVPIQMDPSKGIDTDSSGPSFNQSLGEPEFTYNMVDNITVLRHNMVIVAFKSILMATRIGKGVQVPYNRTQVFLTEGEGEVQVGLLNGRDIKRGIVVVMTTNLSPLILELVPSLGNWYLTRIIFGGNKTFYPRDRIFFGFDFSLCCSDITVFASDTARLSFFDFHLDILYLDKDNGMDSNYEVKPCWSCSVVLTPALSQTIFVMLIIVSILCIGMAMILSIGQNRIMLNANDPELHVKTDT
ncbi:uncharacterized protein LOC108094516 [Drosophila ficusphila]|uniref:uncharacterized protein LOC108094516 n=1 Tax=Drosophila ficusphila TaxID=30025 RepID=UPI001C8A7B79|nr:uncharacterized protein LOC108094516 [Drosophila ficusphila]